jgi:hypothetical protein
MHVQTHYNRGDHAMSQSVRNGMSAADLAGVTWRKSRRSGQLGNCVEAAVLDSGDVAVRNSRHPGGPALIFTREEMASFLAGARDGEFDDLAC